MSDMMGLWINMFLFLRGDLGISDSACMCGTLAFTVV